MTDKFIWSFAGPITFSGIVSVFMFVMSMKAFCREKISVTDVTSLRYTTIPVAMSEKISDVWSFKIQISLRECADMCPVKVQIRMSECAG